MNFAKMESAGNDFIIIDNRTPRLSAEQLSQIASTLCQRRTALGADALIVIENPETDTDLRIKMYNADGSSLEMCSNGIRCAARYAFEHHLAGAVMRIESCGRRVQVSTTDPGSWKLQLDPPDLEEPEHTWEAENDTVTYAYLEFGGMPHAVIRHPGLTVRDIQNQRLLAIAQGLRYSERYPKGVNVSFYDSAKEGEATVITYERGAETFTPSCGIGACASAIVMMRKRETYVYPLNVRVPMGEYRIEVEWDPERKEVKGLYLSGKTRMIAEGNTLEV